MVQYRNYIKIYHKITTQQKLTCIDGWMKNVAIHVIKLINQKRIERLKKSMWFKTRIDKKEFNIFSTKCNTEHKEKKKISTVTLKHNQRNQDKGKEQYLQWN